MRTKFIQQFRRLIIFGQVAEFIHLEEVFVGEILFTEIFIDDGVICQHSSYEKFRLTFPCLISWLICIIRILYQTGTAKIIRKIRDITQPLTTQEY